MGQWVGGGGGGLPRWEWYTSHDLVVMGYSLRTPAWRYTAWLLWDPNSTEPVWSYPPQLGEELYDHRGGGGDGGEVCSRASPWDHHGGGGG